MYVELKPLLPNAEWDLRYATKNNITKKVLYRGEDAIPRLEKETAGRLVYASRLLIPKSLKLVIYDTLRTPEAHAELMAVINDENYCMEDSNHLRGTAVDAGLADKKGNRLDMGTFFDETRAASHVGSPYISEQQTFNRNILISTMRMAGFEVWPYEWWHFDFKGHANR